MKPIFKTKMRIKTVLLGLALAFGSAAQAQANVCGSPFNPAPVIAPVLPSPSFSQSDAAVNCYMWQTFIYLTWPALGGQRGQPDPQATYGAAGPTVWETFRPFETVFLSNGQKPAAWNDGMVASKNRKRMLLAPRKLSNTSKVFRPLGGSESTTLDETTQAGGGVLVDQHGQPVYYEMLLNETEFNYITSNQLYDAGQQAAFAQATGLALPAGSIEIKAAWKVLSTQEANQSPSRFHTTQAILPKQAKPVTMGLVGLHVMVMPSANNFYQGFWATFTQADNAPLLGSTPSGNYSFYNTQCGTAQCPVNSQTKPPAPTQVEQVFGPPPEAQAVNTYVNGLLQSSTLPNAVWRYYALVDVQWPTSPQPIAGAGKSAPLPNGTPNTNTLMNPVLETFLQRPNVSCLGCHSGATTAQANGFAQFASSYSFLFGHAKQASNGPPAK